MATMIMFENALETQMDIEGLKFLKIRGNDGLEGMRAFSEKEDLILINKKFIKIHKGYCLHR